MKNHRLQPILLTVCTAALLSLPLSGCSLFEDQTPAVSASKPNKAEPTIEQQPSADEDTADLTAASVIEWAASEEPALQPIDPAAGAQITLVDDPRFYASSPSKTEPTGKQLNALVTKVNPAAQTYLIRFAEPMQRNTVEQAVQANLNHPSKLYSTLETSKSTAAFVWQDDQTVKVTITPTVLPNTPYARLGYLVDPNGAKTKTNQLKDNMPIFSAILDLPKQLWRLSLETGQSEKLGLPAAYYHTHNFISADQRYLLLERNATYCECDRDPGSIHDLYDFKTNKLTRYNLELYTSYRGPGKFYVDRRGFMFAADSEEAAKVAEASGSHVITVELPGFIHGAAFSKDFTKLLIALGEEEQKKDFDFVIYDIGSRQTRTFAKALPGYAEASQVDSRIYPIRMIDDSQHVAILLGDGQDLAQHWFRYDWTTGKIEPWTPPATPGQEGYFDFTASADGEYLVSFDKQLYQQDQKIMDIPDHSKGVWMPVSDQYVALHEKIIQPATTATQPAPATTPDKPQPAQNEYSVSIVDPTSKSSKPLLSGMKVPVDLVGVDPTEKWLYLMADTRITKLP
ncbi:hypothetical protein [Brevibacillus dissolubilis]|uniref:hypothetical protein n=1 Tax=Brevibacillus dissolubilis TaxID=1844116 RepID=UPI0011178378|nr:hypothetical protein [Brevibacillus dissolubilis]